MADSKDSSYVGDGVSLKTRKDSVHTGTYFRNKAQKVVKQHV